MKTAMLFVAAAVFASVEAPAQSLSLNNVTSGIYCRFDPNCQVSPVTASSSFSPTNLAVTCVLESRSFPGKGMDAKGIYGYEYRLTLNNNGEDGTNFFTVDSLAVNFNQPESFAYGLHASNQVWIVTDGAGSVAPGSANFSGTNVVFQFNPPLVLATLTNKTINTYLFGMISTNSPHLTKAIVSGSLKTSADSNVSFDEEMQARTP
ncbi:MAG TPA: hypothetical protein VFV23_04470 [Verrucomicrobiae bacterium]|nr:hypothetical protein [Verrucomicrobiae bacterium]